MNATRTAEPIPVPKKTVLTRSPCTYPAAQTSHCEGHPGSTQGQVIKQDDCMPHRLASKQRLVKLPHKTSLSGSRRSSDMTALGQLTESVRV